MMRNLAWLRFVAFTLTVVLGLTSKTVLAAPENEEERFLALLEARRQRIADVMEEATVFILALNEDEDSVGMGTGFVIGDGLIMTNAHVVEGADEWIVLNNKLGAVEASLISVEGTSDGAPGEADFALLRIETNVKLPILSFNTQIKRMDRVSAWGFPHLMTQFDQGLEDVLNGDLSKVPPVVYTEGTVNTIVRSENAASILHSAAIASGNSGGPLINGRGEVVGINTWGATAENEGAAVFAALPAENIVRFLQKEGVNPSRRSALDSTPAAALSPAVVADSGPNLGINDIDPRSSSERRSDNVSSLNREQLLRMAGTGYDSAQYQLGYNYYYGEDGYEENEREAYKWLKKAADQGHPDGMGLLGVLRVLSSESYGDVPQGLALIEQAAKINVSYAEVLARFYYEGEGYGVARDVEKAYSYAKQGSDAERADAQAILGLIHYFGEDVEAIHKQDRTGNRTIALNLAQKAVQEGNMLGQSLLAWIYYSGEVVQKSPEKAFGLALDAAEDDESSAMALLAMLYYTGEGVKKDEDAAREWAQRASDSGNEFGHLILGSLFADEGIKAANNDSKPMKKIAAQSLPSAWAYLTLAADKGLGIATERLAEIDPYLTSDQKTAGRQQRDAWRTERGLAR